MEKFYASNEEFFHGIAKRHYTLYKEHQQRVDDLKQLFKCVDISVVEGELTVPENLKPKFQELKEQGELLQDESCVAILFEAFAVEAYVKKISNAFDKKIFKGIAPTNTRKRFYKIFETITGLEMPENQLARIRIHKLFEIRHNLVHSNSVLVDDVSKIQDAIIHLRGDGNILATDVIDEVIETLPVCVMLISGAAQIFMLDDND